MKSFKEVYETYHSFKLTDDLGIGIIEDVLRHNAPTMLSSTCINDGYYREKKSPTRVTTLIFSAKDLVNSIKSIVEQITNVKCDCWIIEARSSYCDTSFTICLTEPGEQDSTKLTDELQAIKSELVEPFKELLQRLSILDTSNCNIEVKGNHVEISVNNNTYRLSTIYTEHEEDSDELKFIIDVATKSHKTSSGSTIFNTVCVTCFEDLLDTIEEIESSSQVKMQ